MLYTVHATSEVPGGGIAELKATTKKNAVETAVGLLGQGLKNVTITDENGRVFDAAHFDDFFLEDDD